MSSFVIAVGIDGSEGSRRALRWALEEARLRDCAVEAVTAWPPRGESLDGSPEQAARMRREADELQRHVLAGVLDEVDNPPTVSREIVQGDAIDVLLRSSVQADLLVVGSHGTSGLRHAALGSVSEACARLSECPSVVVPVSTRAPHRNEVALVPDTEIGQDPGGATTTGQSAER